MTEWAAEHNFWLQHWLGLKLWDPLLMYMGKVILKFQLRASLEAKVEISCPVSYCLIINFMRSVHLCK
jgi:hypothetical protein